MFTASQLLDKINNHISEIQFTRTPKGLYEPIEYILSLGGKRIRPVLMLMGYNLYREDVASIYDPATAIEVYHNHTLLHDDLMDRSDVRRGKPTVHKVWNDNTAVLSGDAMLILAFRYMTGCPQEHLKEVMDLFKLLSSRSISIPPLKQYRPTRDLLHVNGLLLTGDTLDVFVCHLPSRSGGAKESESYRLYAAHILRMEVDSIMSIRSLPQVIIMGDFNDYPTNQSIQKILEAEAPPVTTNNLASTTGSTNFSTVAPSSLKLYHLLARKAKSKDFGIGKTWTE